MRSALRVSLAAAIVFAAAVLAAVLSGAATPGGRPVSAAACPAGFEREADGCVRAKHPESLFEHIVRQEGLESVRSAPYDTVAPGAYSNAVSQAQALKGTKISGTEGAWTQLGTSPLIVNDSAYTSVNGLGLVYNEGRIDSLDYDAAHGRLFAALGTGGVWMSDDLGDHWRSIGDSLPSQVVGAVAWSEANGGTIVALSGDPTYGSGGYTGYGAFYSSDLGQSWQKATGVPDGALGFEIAVDPSNPATVYAATSKGLFRSTDGGRTYANVRLPVGEAAPGVDCTGVEGGGKCQLANMVTDVAVAAPGGVNQNVAPGTVVAVVGWRASDRKNSDGTIQSPGNGIYRSATGAPGTFERVAVTGWPSQTRQGRVELGPTTGPQQDHDYLYAIVQDAAALNGQLDVVDVNGIPDPRGGQGTVLNGVYVSSDFGKTWTLMADDNGIAKNPATGSALVGYGQASGYEPGIQAWYNEWIAPDPTRQTADGIPTRLAFGLEEVWQNELPTPLSGPATFKVIGRYFSGDTCSFLALGLPECPTNRPPTTSTTTHPDQHEGMWIPDGSGGVTLTATNDGGFYRAHVGAGQELDNGKWGDGNQTGFQTLLPYSVAMANDGTVWAGLQDNGHMKIDPATGKQYETYGGDGTFAAVDPNNSKIAYEAYVYNAMKVTTDGGKSWTAVDPKVTNTRFVNPFDMDPTNAKHLVTAGREVVETVYGPDTTAPFDASDSDGDKSWVKVFDLGTQKRPGDAAASASASDPANQMSAIDVYGNAVYVGFCGVCDILNATATFKSGIATNVGGSAAPQSMTGSGWHVAKAAGLPNRFITSIAISPKDPKTIYVALGGYSRRWVPPGTLQDSNQNVGVGHVFVSHDAGETFTDVSGNLPDAPATWVTLRASQVIVGTDVGVYASDLKGGTTYAPLVGLPVVPISAMTLKPNDPNLLAVATYGRGVWTYRFAKALPGTRNTGTTTTTETPPAPTGASLAGPFGFELTNEGWTVSSSSANGLNLTQWKRGTPGATSTTSFQVTPYTDESTTSLTSPAISQSGGWVFVDFQRKQDTEPGFDFLNVEWSTDGANWNAAPWIWDSVNGVWSDQLAFSGTNPAYPSFNVDKVAFKVPAGTLQVRFRLSSDQLISSPLYQGVWVDDVSIHQ